MSFSVFSNHTDASDSKTENSLLAEDTGSRSIESGTNDSSGPIISTLARIAIYDDLLSSPRIIDIEPAPLLMFIENIATETYERARLLGGRLPYSTIREIVENFIHADFRECTVSILDNGNTVRFSDQGPGIEKKLLVQQPGVTSASSVMRRYIKGVGSGLPLVREYLEVHEGSLRIDDNAVAGTVVTLSLAPPPAAASAVSGGSTLSGTEPAVFEQTFTGAFIQPSTATTDEVSSPSVDAIASLFGTVDLRARAALSVIADLGAAGPTDLVEPLGISASTGTRLLDKLEEAGLIEKTSNRKRILSNAGLTFWQRLSGS